MTESVQQVDEEAPSWQTPDFVVVETALEVTAYFLSDR
ncbi:pyrroloquinoline quinone precursor peptide PqqA [Streptomyces phaeolivaceus]|uniref:Coenzyme PQQ synthesis protein A n=1 Tax=Streptomyces phaeolivaceus TaxID=2653200 RepID=A0A5P8JVB0_9ACTN|nr:pyrroloquinoline quinone precursor peptide PqqA [Streptomyces phaeolivaceus]QFQ94933.1 pyrroloquinoline quinone precursor peptide PqqA [Streptomyces phaeolivaceus]